MIKFLKGVTHLPWRQMRDVLRVFAFGAWKHRNDLWFEAGYTWQPLYRKANGHIARWLGDQTKDEETGLHPLAHAICDLLMAWAIDIRQKGGDRQTTKT